MPDADLPTTRESMAAMGAAAREAAGILDGVLWDAYVEEGLPYGDSDDGFARWRRELHDPKP